MRVTTPYKVEDRGWPNFNLQHRLLRDGQGKLAIIYQREKNILSAGFSDNGGRDWSEPVDILSKMGTHVAAVPAWEGFHAVCAGDYPPKLWHLYGKDQKWDVNVLENTGEGDSLFFAPDLALYGEKGVIATCAQVDNKSGGWGVSCRERNAGGLWNKTGKMPWAGRDKGTISPGEKNSWRLYAQSLCTDGEGQIHLAYRDLKDGYLQIFYSRYLPSKSAWSTLKQITATPYHKGAPSIMWDERGIVLAWTTNYGDINVVELCPSVQDKSILKVGPATGQAQPLLRIVKGNIWLLWQWKGKILFCPRDETDRIWCVMDLTAGTSRVEFDAACEPDGEKIYITVADTGADGIITFAMVPLADVLQSSVINDQLPDVSAMESVDVKEQPPEKAEETARSVNHFSEDDELMKINPEKQCCLKEENSTGETPCGVINEGDITGHLSESPVQTVHELPLEDANNLEEDMCSSSIWIPAKKLNREKTTDEERCPREWIKVHQSPSDSTKVKDAAVLEPKRQETVDAKDRSRVQVEVRILPPVAINAPVRYETINETENETETVDQSRAETTATTLETVDLETPTPVIDQEETKNGVPEYFAYNLYKMLY